MSHTPATSQSRDLATSLSRDLAISRSPSGPASRVLSRTPATSQSRNLALSLSRTHGGMNRIELPLCVRILDTFSVKYAALFAIGIGTGCRISEILSLRRSDLIDETGELRQVIRFLKLKSRSKKPEFRELVIPEALQGYVTRLLNQEMNRGYTSPDDWVFRGCHGRHLTRFTVYDAMKRTFAMFGLRRNYATHSMRKTFAHAIFNYFLNENPADPMRALELTRQALGHSRLETTVRYLGIRQGQIHQAQHNIFAKIGVREWT